MTALVERLALTIPAPCVCVGTPLCNQHLAAVDALRAALREAARVAKHTASYSVYAGSILPAPKEWRHIEVASFVAERVAAAIEALAE